MANPSTIHESTFAFYVESTPGQPPGWTSSLPYGTAAGWTSASSSGDAPRMRHFEADPTYLRPSVIADPAMVDSTYQKNAPIPGISSVEGGAIALGLHGSEAATAGASQVSQTDLMTLLEHSLGGIHRSNTTAVASSPTSGVEFDVDSATNITPGCLIALEDADATGELYAQRVLTVSSTSLTGDELPNFTIAEDDVVHAVATLYPHAANLMAGDSDYTTLSLFYQKGDKRWLGTGCKLQLDGITMARNELPLLNFSAWAANAFPPSSNSISAPTWTGSVSGIPGLPVGAKTTVRISDAGTSAYTCVDVVSMEFEAGVPVVPLPTVTQCQGEMEGRAGYVTGPGDTVLTVQVYLAAGWQDDFDGVQNMEVTIEQRSEAGKFWCLKLPLCNLMESPEYGQSDEVSLHTLKFLAREPSNVTNGSYPELAKAKFLLGLG